MKQKIITILNGFDPYDRLNWFIEDLSKKEQREAYTILKELVKEGASKHSFIALAVIEFQKPDFLEVYSLELMEIKDSSRYENLLIHIVAICQLFQKEVHFNFMIKALAYTKKSKMENEWQITLNYILDTKFWRAVIPEFLEIVSGTDKSKINYMMGRFIIKHSLQEITELLDYFNKIQLEKLLFNENGIIFRVLSFSRYNMTKIDDKKYMKQQEKKNKLPMSKIKFFRKEVLKRLK